MHIAILITNTDFSDFAKARPDDGEKFAELIHEVRPDWRTTPFWVCKDEFPDNPASFDGVLITGSPASLSDGEPWMAKLEILIQQIVESGQPLFGACFGHQAIAKALGSEIMRNPNGWGHGRLVLNRKSRTSWSGPDNQMSLYGSHIEQVAKAPEGSVVVFEGDGCPVAGFAIGTKVFTVQHHPEMTHEFISDLVDHYADYVGEAVTKAARESLEIQADRAEFAEEIARFFEVACGCNKKLDG